jgi:hypothetical protein
MPKVAGLGTQFMIGTRVWCDPIRDDWSSYTNGADLDTQNGGCGFEQPYADRPNFPYVNAYDNLTNYSNGASLNGLNSGYGWKVGGISQPYVDKSL